MNCPPRLRVDAFHFPQVIISFENTQDSIEINLKRYNCLYQLHSGGIVSLDLDFKMQFGNSLFYIVCQRQKTYLGPSV